MNIDVKCEVHTTGAYTAIPRYRLYHVSVTEI